MVRHAEPLFQLSANIRSIIIGYSHPTVLQSTSRIALAAALGPL